MTVKWSTGETLTVQQAEAIRDALDDVRLPVGHLANLTDVQLTVLGVQIQTLVELRRMFPPVPQKGD